MLTTLVNQIKVYGAVWVPKDLAKAFIVVCVSRGIIATGGIIQNGCQLFTL